MRENRSALCTLQVCCRIILIIRRRRLTHATRHHLLPPTHAAVGATECCYKATSARRRRMLSPSACACGRECGKRCPSGWCTSSGATCMPKPRWLTGSAFGQLALRSLLSAPHRALGQALGCPRLRPASAAQLLLERLWPATHRARSRHRAPRSSLRAGRPKGGRDPPPLAPVRTANR